MAKATLLGSGGWIPTARRETCCAYFRRGPNVLLIDAGTGIQRLIETPDLLAGVERIDLVLTHFHLDHTAGLSYLPALPLRPVLWGPGELLYGTPTSELLTRLLGRPLFAAPLDAIVHPVNEVPGERFEAGPFELATRVQRMHPDPTLALRVGDAITYCTDTAADPATAAFAAGSRILFHEAWHASASTEDEGHSAAGEVGRIARDARVERLVLIHVDPLLGSDEELAAPARAEFANAEVGQDLEELDVDV